MPVYLDNNATTQPLDEVVQAMHEANQRYWANPSSVHRAGQAVRNEVEKARSYIANLIGAREREVVFTSGATESNNLALRGITALRKDRRVILTTALEHSAIRQPGQAMTRDGFCIVNAPVDEAGTVRTEAFESLLDEHGDDVAMASVHWANNETGVIQPIRELAAACRKRRVPFHTDATQAVGKLPVDVVEAGIDALSLSAHKFHGPKGVGALYVRASQRLRPQIIGGPQERERRGGTENTVAVIAAGVAAREAEAWLATDGTADVARLRDRFERGVCEAVSDAVINSAGASRLPNTTNIAFPSLEAEAIVVLLSERGVYASAGAACSSGSLEPSPVLLAMNLPEPIAHGSVRFSLSRFTTGEEVDEAIETIAACVERLKRTMPVGH